MVAPHSLAAVFDCRVVSTNFLGLRFFSQKRKSVDTWTMSYSFAVCVYIIGKSPLVVFCVSTKVSLGL